MTKFNLKTASIIIIFVAITNQARGSELGFWYTGANPDYKPFSTDYGLGLTWQLDLDQNSYISFLYNETEFNPSGPVVGRLIVESWSEVAYNYRLFDNFFVAGSYTSADTTDGTLDGFGVHVGYDIQWSKQLSSRIQVGHIDTEFSDYQLVGSLNYQINDEFSVEFKLRDYHEWDYTAYEAGIIYSY